MLPISSPAMPRRPVTSVVKRVAAGAGAAVYLLAIAGLLFQSVVGDSAYFPLSYFFTWDMFPAHNTNSMRRVAVGKTAAGKFLQLHPSPRDQYRQGVNRDFTRVDLEGRGFFYRPIVEQTLQTAGGGDSADPVAHVHLFERYWPAKFNYPTELYEAWSGTPRPHRTFWRVVEEFDVPAPRPLVDSSHGDGP